MSYAQHVLRRLYQARKHIPDSEHIFLEATPEYLVEKVQILYPAHLLFPFQGGVIGKSCSITGTWAITLT